MQHLLHWDESNQKSTREKGTQYKDATIRNKFTQTVNIITYNTISIQTMPHPCTCVESGIKITEWKIMTLYLGLVFEICETLKFKKLATSKMEPF